MCLLATSDFGQEIQEDVNAIVGHNENFNNAVIRRVLDLKNAGIFQNPNPLTVIFRDIKKFDVQNPIIGKLASQVKVILLDQRYPFRPPPHTSKYRISAING